MVFSPFAIILMEVTKSFYRSPQLQCWFFASVYMGLGQKHPHPEILDKQHTRLLWVNTPKNIKF
jgi:hypothetical protein